MVRAPDDIIDAGGASDEGLSSSDKSLEDSRKEDSNPRAGL